MGTRDVELQKEVWHQVRR